MRVLACHPLIQTWLWSATQFGSARQLQVGASCIDWTNHTGFCCMKQCSLYKQTENCTKFIIPIKKGEKRGWVADLSCLCSFFQRVTFGKTCWWSSSEYRATETIESEAWWWLGLMVWRRALMSTRDRPNCTWTWAAQPLSWCNRCGLVQRHGWGVRVALLFPPETENVASVSPSMLPAYETSWKGTLDVENNGSFFWFFLPCLWLKTCHLT